MPRICWLPNCQSNSASNSDHLRMAPPSEKSRRGRRSLGLARLRWTLAVSGPTVAEIPAPTSEIAWPMLEIGLTKPLATPLPTPTTAPSRPPAFQPSAGFLTTSRTPSMPWPKDLPASWTPSAKPWICLRLRICRCLATYSSSKVKWFISDAASPATSPMVSVRKDTVCPPMRRGTRGRFSNELFPKATPALLSKFIVYSLARPRRKSLRDPRCKGTFRSGSESVASSSVSSSLKERTRKASRQTGGKKPALLNLSPHQSVSLTGAMWSASTCTTEGSGGDS
mmetsp:Transcript_17297/g.43233  ORF Transcript_17297/g.43233 Transcript_17297/m.43233 type:complete len:282 (-) Transcript_17297:1263-2108(-)